MKKYKINFANDHCLINDGNGYFLVDTGSPVSFCEKEEICLDGTNYKVQKETFGLDAKYISEKAGTDVIGLIGMDLIVRQPVMFDYKSGEIVWGYEYEGGINVSPEVMMVDIPRIEMKLNGQRVKLAIDTGAPISYINKSFTTGLVSVGTADDFSPFVGNFKTNLYELNSSVGGKEWTGVYGTLPMELEMMNMFFGIDGVIGKQLFERFQVIIDNNIVILQ